MERSDLARYGLWAGVAVTAAGNRRQYPDLPTAWLPHLLLNSAALLLPEAARALLARLPAERRGLAGLARALLCELVCDNPRYVAYVAPLAAGYMLSSPWLNIYKGRLSELELAGLGLDALPHAATAAALSQLVCDASSCAAGAVEPASWLAPPLGWCRRHPAAASGLALALATLVWELGEYRIYQHEIARHGHRDRINMQWSLRDTAQDCAANLLGWAFVAWRGRPRRSQEPGSS